ncbi:hypothetical protein [Halopelagius inordinatus]
MRQLRSCDFCGADSDGVYEVLPPQLSPTESQQRRVALCADCLDTLETVVEPLLDRLDVESGGDGESGDGERGCIERGRSERGRTERSDSQRSNTPMMAGGDPNGGLSEEASDPASGGERDDHGRTADPETSGIADATDEEAGSPLREADAESAGEREAAGDGTDAGGESADADAAAGEEPPQFRKVMRLLNNREFPVDRTDVEELASGAYDLDDDHVRDIIDYAVERGVLADDGGTLRKP